MNSIDIAKIAGVSRSTVSRVINNYPNVPEETRRKVQEVIKKYNYVPQASARMLAGGKNRVIGLFIIDMSMDSDTNKVSSSSYFSPFTSAVIDNASKLGYNVLVSFVSRSKDYKNVKDVFYNKTITGGIFIGVRTDEPEINEIINAGFKVALVNRTVKLDDEIYNKCIIVNADNFSGAYNATEYLLNLGHTKIAHVTGEAMQSSSEERVEGYKKALSDFGINVKNNLIVKGNFLMDGGYNATRKLILKHKPTAIFLSNDTMAIGAIEAIKEAGLRVPQDISIIGFDDIEVAKYLHPALTTVRVSLLKIASIAINSLITSIENNSNFSANYVVPVDLIERESCRVIKK